MGTRKWILMAAIAATSATGCTTRLTDFTVLATKNLDLGSLGQYKRGPTRVRGEDMSHIIIFIPTGTPNIKEAIDRALESVPGAVALVDGVVYLREWYIPFIYGQNAFIVEGTPLIRPDASKAEPGPFIVSTYDPVTKRFSSHGVSRSDFLSMHRSYATASLR